MMHKILLFFKSITLISFFFLLIGCPTGNRSPNNSCADSLLDENVPEQSISSGISYRNNIGTLGIGVVNPKDFSFELLLDTLGGQQIQIPNIETQDYIVPLLNKFDYLVFYMITKEIYPNYYEIYFNKGSTAFVKKNEFNFYHWPDFLMNTLSISAGKGYADRFDLGTAIELNEVMNFKVQSVDGDWILVKEESDDEGKFGDTEYWVRWRDEGNLLIIPYFIM